MDDTKATVGIYNWYEVLTKETAEAIKKAVTSGMPIQLAERIIREVLRTALSEAVIVRRGKEGQGV